jgi:hypothetical protein
VTGFCNTCWWQPHSLCILRLLQNTSQSMSFSFTNLQWFHNDFLFIPPDCKAFSETRINKFVVIDSIILTNIRLNAFPTSLWFWWVSVCPNTHTHTHTHTHNVLSPFASLLSRRAQSGRWYSFRETGVVHRITCSFNYFFFTCCFIYSIYSWYKIMERYIQ